MAGKRPFDFNLYATRVYPEHTDGTREKYRGSRVNSMIRIHVHVYARKTIECVSLKEKNKK